MRQRLSFAPLGLVIALAATGCGGPQGVSGAPVATMPPVAVAPGPAPSPSPAPEPTPAPNAPARLAFADEFEAGALDRTKWNVAGPDLWVNNEQQAYIDSPDTITVAAVPGASDGALVIRPRFRPGLATPGGRKTDFVSGRINTADKFSITHGTVAARIRMPAGQGFWPAFWLLGYGAWPDCGEIDTMEYVGEKDWTSAAIHGPGYSGDTPLVQRQTFPAGSDVTGWHVYSVERTRDAVIFRVDDREYYRVTRAQVERYGAWRFDRPQYIILNFALGGVYPHAVNTITAPYFGLSQASVDAVKAGSAAMEVDWVRAWSAD